MAMTCGSVFTVFLIMGFQIPVTMFPANSDSVAVPLHFRLGGTSDDTLLKDQVLKGKLSSREINVNTDESSRPVQYVNQGIDRFRDESTLHNPVSVEEYRISRASAQEQTRNSDLIESDQTEHQLNRHANQVHPGDHQGFNDPQDLTGLPADLDTNYIKSVKSDISQLSQDLLNIKLGRIKERIVNVSVNLSAKRNIFPTDSGRMNPVNEKVANNNTKQMKTNDIEINNIDNSAEHEKDRLNISKLKHFESLNTVGSEKTNSGGPKIKHILWSEELVNGCPKLHNAHDQKEWKRKSETLTVVKIEPGCGSMQNRIITFNDSSKACVRYRLNSDLMQGDIYSFYLAQLLGLNYIPPTTMQVVDPASEQWRLVQDEVIGSKWSNTKPIILTKWMESSGTVFMPAELKDDKIKLQPENHRFAGRSNEELCDLVQWSDLIVFDYISANLDRVVNNMFNLKWNPNMLEKPIHNLEKSKSGQFLFFDNESGLFHGYRLLDTYETYLKSLLDSVCVFRKSTVDLIEKLYTKGDIGATLQDVYQSNERFHGFLPRMPPKNMQTLQGRLATVYKHIQLCKNRYPDVATS